MVPNQDNTQLTSEFRRYANMHKYTHIKHIGVVNATHKFDCLFNASHEKSACDILTSYIIFNLE